MKDPFAEVDKALGVFDPVETAIRENKITVPRTIPKSDADDIENDYKYQLENFIISLKEVKMQLRVY